MSEECQTQSFMLPDDGAFPNNPTLPLLLYPGAFLPFGVDPAAQVEAQFNANGWPAAWRNGVYSYHHYHSRAHEALGVYCGWARIQFGGPSGRVFKITSGDAAVLPAGTAHRLVRASRDFSVVGAYPPGQHPDMRYGKPGGRAGADERIARVPMPDTDPVTGRSGGIVSTWRTD